MLQFYTLFEVQLYRVYRDKWGKHWAMKRETISVEDNSTGYSENIRPSEQRNLTFRKQSLQFSGVWKLGNGVKREVLVLFQAQCSVFQ